MPSLADRYSRLQKDPGASGSIKPIYANTYFGLVSATAESRTLARPFRVGIICTLQMKTDGGDITVTVTGGYDEIASSTLVFNDAGQYATFVGVSVGTTLTWRLMGTNALGSSPGIVDVTNAASYSVLAANSGKIHIMPNFTSSCTLTLPTALAGLNYTFIGKAVADDAENWIFSTGGANFWLGGLSFADTDAGAGADEIHAGVFPNGSSNDFMTIVTPGAGTLIRIVCDGTNWIANGQVFSATVPTFSDT